MNIIYFIGVIIALIGIIALRKTYKIKLVKRSNKDIVKPNSSNENSIEKIEHNTDSNETTSADIFDIKIKTKPKKSKKTQQAKIEEKETSIITEEINRNIAPKNSFLHEADDFGTMEKGVVLDGKIYTYENQIVDEFEIQPATEKSEKNNSTE
jgi:hypothetical protein